MIEKVKSILVVVLMILACVAAGMSIITDCQKAILQNSLSQTIDNQNEINDKISEVLKTIEEIEVE